MVRARYGRGLRAWCVGGIIKGRTEEFERVEGLFGRLAEAAAAAGGRRLEAERNVALVVLGDHGRAVAAHDKIARDCTRGTPAR